MAITQSARIRRSPRREICPARRSQAYRDQVNVEDPGSYRWPDPPRYRNRPSVRLMLRARSERQAQPSLTCQTAFLIDVPEGVDLQAAAAMGVAGVTAWRTVTELAQVTADDTVLVLGASGGVGSIIVSVAHALGATVAGQTGHEDNAAWIKERGADHVLVADAGHLAGAVADLRPTAAFDGLGDGFTGAAIEALQPHGRLVLFGTSAAPEGQVPLRSLYGKGLRVLGYAGLLESDEAMNAAIREALQALADGRLTVPVDSAMPLEQLNEAFDRIRQRQVRGKIVLNTRA